MPKVAITGSISKSDETEAKQHIFIALDQMAVLPANQDQLIEWMRDYFEAQKVSVFSRIIPSKGEQGFKDFIAQTVIENGRYFRDEDGVVKPVPNPG